MFQESMVVRNLAVLQRLQQGEASLEEIAAATRFRIYPIQRSLQQLVQQAAVEQNGERYRLKADSDKVMAALELIGP